MDNSNFFNKGISTPIGIVIIVVVTLLAGGIFAWQYLETPEEEVKVPEEIKIPEEKIEETAPEEIIADETANLKIYRNEEYGFEIKYPKDYKIHFPPILQYPQQDTLYVVDFMPKDKTVSDFTIGITSQSKSIEQQIVSFRSFLELHRIEEIVKETDVIISGIKSKRIDYTNVYLESQGIKVYPGSKIYISSSKYNYIFSVNPDLSPILGNKFNQMLSTFRFLE